MGLNIVPVSLGGPVQVTLPSPASGQHQSIRGARGQGKEPFITVSGNPVPSKPICNLGARFHVLGIVRSTLHGQVDLIKSLEGLVRDGILLGKTGMQTGIIWQVFHSHYQGGHHASRIPSGRFHIRQFHPQITAIRSLSQLLLINTSHIRPSSINLGLTDIVIPRGWTRIRRKRQNPLHADRHEDCDFAPTRKIPPQCLIPLFHFLHRLSFLTQRSAATLTVVVKS